MMMTLTTTSPRDFQDGDPCACVQVQLPLYQEDDDHHHQHCGRHDTI